MITKNQLVRNLVAERDYKHALQICKDWDYSDAADRDALRLGYDCLMHPEFYRQLGRDPVYQYELAVAVLIRIYG